MNAQQSLQLSTCYRPLARLRHDADTVVAFPKHWQSGSCVYVRSILMSPSRHDQNVTTLAKIFRVACSDCGRITSAIADTLLQKARTSEAGLHVIQLL